MGLDYGAGEERVDDSRVRPVVVEGGAERPDRDGLRYAERPSDSSASPVSRYVVHSSMAMAPRAR